MSGKLWDISQKVRVGIPVWPGDSAYREERTWSIGPGCPVNVCQISLSTHTGTHTDAPLHYDDAGLPMGEVPLDTYIGPCQLLTIPPGVGLAGVAHVVPFFQGGTSRLLLRTFERFPNGWISDFTAIDPALMDWLAARGVRLIGTDAPSVDPQDSKSLDAHMAVRRHGMAILEGLVLDGVADGFYELIAPPLRLATADASPVRAVLRELSCPQGG
ncbi:MULTISPECIES: arylformamidase [unclassified Azospirillum]|uniref:arylformamidase n=1 Tax=unclassified Azospirillum TaxID=2630922 RepID=UPI000B7151DE|nr:MULTISPECIES: arylformamidase [unclassified Azospirillum]SNS77670.1 Kynurenine formamidase [Azospirillum sp. RU38E]SNS94836.1 Kynurenine formamidase [Azospirillum sp. RU37A]